MLVELGGGTNPHPRADIVIDIHHPRGAPEQDAANTPWVHGFNIPYPVLDTGSVDEIYCSHFMEHIPKGQPIINVMNEAWRVLKPGGTFTMIMPLVGYTDHEGGHLVEGWQPYADPTHVQGWWLPESLLYFCEGPFKPHADYGMWTWAALGQGISEHHASMNLKRHMISPPEPHSWWAIRGGWEGCAQLVKP